MNSKSIETERISQVVLMEGGVSGERLFLINLFIFNWKIIALRASLVVQNSKESTCNARDLGLIPEL